jgi:putative transposase
MVIKDMTNITLKDLWKEVKSEDDWFGDIKERTLELVKLILEDSLEEELLEQLQACRYQRTEVRRGYRNGYYRRNLFMPFGVIKSIRVPRSRISYQSEILPNYQRRAQQINEMIRTMFLAGVSTRRVGEVLNMVWGEEVSPQTVSNICRSLDYEVESYHRRAIADNYVYLFFDGIVLKTKTSVGVKKRPVLACYGITQAGKREFIDFRLASSESEAQWESFINNLYQRGLMGSNCKLICIDGCKGLRNALGMIYPYIPIQRCWAHKLRNIANYLKRKDQEKCMAGAKLIYLADNRRQAVKAFKGWKSEWGMVYPRAIRCLEKDLDEMLNFLDCPVSHRIKVRTTNIIERSFREVRRRTRTMSCFTNSQSVDRITFGVVNHLNNNWKDKPLPNFTQNI